MCCVLVCQGAGGWDLLLPPGWAMPVWQCLVYSGAIPAGLQQLHQASLETAPGPGSCLAMEDSAWGRAEAAERSAQLRAEHFRLPPDKRPNYAVLGSLAPFARPWSELLGREDWFVLRDVRVLTNLRSGNPQPDYCRAASALVLVRVNIQGKGKLSENTALYMPEQCDLQTQDLNLVEVHHKDDNVGTRKEIKKAHQDKLKQLKRQWKKVKDKKTQLILTSAANDQEVDQNKLSSLEVSLKALKGLRQEEKSTYKEKSEQSWQSGDTSKIKNHNCRTLIGWISLGGYSLKLGGETGLGLIALSSLNLLLSSNVDKILTRQPDNEGYRTAFYHVI